MVPQFLNAGGAIWKKSDRSFSLAGGGRWALRPRMQIGYMYGTRIGTGTMRSHSHVRGSHSRAHYSSLDDDGGERTYL
eukprot:scaffold238150_cov59-Attheya_sp.AAC.2